MRSRILTLSAVLALLPAAVSSGHAQVSNPSFTALPSIPFDTTGPVIQAHTEALKPFTVAGERGVLVGQQDGTFESWILPAKVLSHLTIEARRRGLLRAHRRQPAVGRNRSPARPHHHHLLPHRLHRPPDHVLAARRPRRHRSRRSLPIRLPASHRIHFPLHPRAALDVAGAQ